MNVETEKNKSVYECPFFLNLNMECRSQGYQLLVHLNHNTGSIVLLRGFRLYFVGDKVVVISGCLFYLFLTLSKINCEDVLHSSSVKSLVKIHVNEP